jgi:hypothetical protein
MRREIIGRDEKKTCGRDNFVEKERVNRALSFKKKKKIVEGKKEGRLTIGSPGHSKSNVAVFGKVKKISLSFTY